MSEAFDPYRHWLGVPSGDRPPNHYALLGLSLFEADPEAIENAADRQMAYVRTHQTGPHAAVTQQLLNELAAARVCLLNAARKSQYDAELKARQAASSRQAAATAAPRPVLPVEPRPALQPVAPLAPQLAAPAVPPTFVRPTTLSNVAPRKPAGKLPSWLAPAAGGLATGVLLAAILTLRGGSDRGPSSTATAPQPAPPKAQPAPPLNSQPNSDATASASVPESNGRRLKNLLEETLSEPADAKNSNDSPWAAMFKSLKRPSPLGVTASKLVIWNTHNGYHRDRGALACNVRLLAGGREVWSQENLAMPWSPDEDRSLTVALPPERFERVRIEITKWQQIGGGLGEIEVLSADGRNLAYGQPAVASGEFHSRRFDAERVVDGIAKASEAETGYWLLPDSAPGWVEVDLSLPRPAKLAGVAADKLVIFNQHNGPHNNSGTQWCDATLYSGERVAWRQEHVELPWAPGADLSVERKLPQVAFDRLRVDVAAREGQHAGLAELQLFAGGENLALDCPARGAGFFDQRRCESRVADGIVSSIDENIGYWILPQPQTPGWVEIDLACLDPEYGAACRQLGLSLALVDGDWRRGLLWLARGDNRQLRRLAHADGQETFDVAEQRDLADAWRELAGQAEGELRKRLLARSMWRYRRVLSRLLEFSRPPVQARLDEALPELPERNYLFFMQESELRVVDPLIRERPVVVRSEPSRYGLFLHPPINESSHIAFRLGKRRRRFLGAAAINDTAWNRTQTALIFRVVGDGRELWKSSPLKESGSSEGFDLNVAGVDKLELFVDCPGDFAFAHGAWVEPRLE